MWSQRTHDFDPGRVPPSSVWLDRTDSVTGCPRLRAIPVASRIVSKPKVAGGADRHTLAACRTRPRLRAASEPTSSPG